MTATSGPEKRVTLTKFGDTFAPGEASTLPLLRTCDSAAGTDAHGERSAREAEDATAAQRGEGHGRGPRGGQWLDLLRLVCDVDPDDVVDFMNVPAPFAA